MFSARILLFNLNCSLAGSTNEGRSKGEEMADDFPGFIGGRAAGNNRVTAGAVNGLQPPQPRPLQSIKATQQPVGEECK